MPPRTRKQANSAPRNAEVEECEVGGGSSSSSSPLLRGQDAVGQLVLVTGGGGFLGRYIVEKLVRRGVNVRVFDLRKTWDGEVEAPQDGVVLPGEFPVEERERWGSVEFCLGDLTQEKQVQDACEGVWGVVHVASLTETWGDPNLFRAVNVVGTQNVLSACLAHKIGRLVYTSTPSVVIAGSDIRDGKEDMEYPKSFLDHYTSTKAEAEREVLASNGRNEILATCALRPHAMYGPRDCHFFPQVLSKAREGKTKFAVGSQRNVVDFTYVGNAADAHVMALLALESPTCAVAGQAYFVTNGEPTKFWTFMRTVLRRMGYPEPTRSLPYSVAYPLAWCMEKAALLTSRCFKWKPLLTRYVVCNMCTDHWFSIDKARRDFQYEPLVSQDKALDLTVEHYVAQGFANSASQQK